MLELFGVFFSLATAELVWQVLFPKKNRVKYIVVEKRSNIILLKLF